MSALSIMPVFTVRTDVSNSQRNKLQNYKTTLVTAFEHLFFTTDFLVAACEDLFFRMDLLVAALVKILKCLKCRSNHRPAGA